MTEPPRPRSIGAALLRLGAVALAAGCSLVIGDIELPAEGGGDAAADAARDGEAPDANGRDADPVDSAPPLDAARDAGIDATPPSDARTPDAAPDASLDASLDAGPDAAPDAGPDAAPDAGPPPGPPPADVTTLSGQWHIYLGFSAEGAPALAAAILVVGADGSFELMGLDGSPLAGDRQIAPEPGFGGAVRLNLAPVQGEMSGVLDPSSGLGVLVSDPGFPRPAVAFLARATPPVLPPPVRGLLVMSQFLESPGQGEIATWSSPGGQSYVASERRAVGGAWPDDDATYTRTASNWTRHRLEGDPLSLTLSGNANAAAFVGTLERTDSPIGLAAVWSAQGPEPPSRELDDLFCGGFRLWNRSFAVERARLVHDARNRTLQFGLNRPSGYVARGAIHAFEGNVLFERAAGLAVLTSDRRALLVLPATLGDGPSGDLEIVSMDWGFALCVSRWPAAGRP